MPSDRDDDRRARVEDILGTSPKQIAEGLAPSLRKHYGTVLQETIPDHLQALVDRMSDGDPPSRTRRKP
jgi:hypothetical protein